MIEAGTRRGALTIDVEDYFQVQAFADVVPRDAWEGMPRRVEANTERVLALLEAAGVAGTFFTLGWVAERHPRLVRRIVAAGHELASHGYGHERADRQTPDAFRADVRRARRLLEDLGGVAVRGYRAPTFSIGPRNQWAYAVLRDEGYGYSSSTYPVRHDLYGTPDGERLPHSPCDAFWEIPMSTLRFGRANLPVSGGGWFRLLPYTLFRLALRRFDAAGRGPAIFYLHPWELDPAQPRIAAGSRRARLRHYVNLAATAGRLEALLADFAWDRMDRVYAGLLAAPAERRAA